MQNNIIIFLIAIGIVGGAYIYYEHTQAAGQQACGQYGAQLDLTLKEQMKASQETLGQTHYSFRDNTCYQDVTYSADDLNNQLNIYSYIRDVYANRTLSFCDILGTEQQPGCSQYFKDFDRLFWKLYSE